MSLKIPTYLLYLFQLNGKNNLKIIDKTPIYIYNLIFWRNSVLHISKPVLLTCEYRTPFIGSDNQSWANGKGVSGT